MGRFVKAVEVASGSMLLLQLESVNRIVGQAKDAVFSAGRAYAAFRAELNGDADDVALADQRFAGLIGDVKTSLAGETPEVQGVVKQFLNGILS